MIMQDALKSYIKCALWSSLDDEEPLDESYGTADIAHCALAGMCEDVNHFIETLSENGVDWKESLTPKQLGHDLWLTRNGHGAGFWDRDLGELGEQLSAWAKTLGECDLYVGDDNLIYF